MLYHEDSEIAQVQSLDENTEVENPPVQAELIDVPEESLIQLSKDVDEVDDGTPNQIGQID